MSSFLKTEVEKFEAWADKEYPVEDLKTRERLKLSDFNSPT